MADDVVAMVVRVPRESRKHWRIVAIDEDMSLRAFVEEACDRYATHLILERDAREAGE